ncbi:MAG: DUF5717 family protein [Enterocloster sp.]
MIYKDMIRHAGWPGYLPGILKSCRVRCGDSRMKYVIVRYEELERVRRHYLLEDQAAYVPLFSDRSVRCSRTPTATGTWT